MHVHVPDRRNDIETRQFEMTTPKRFPSLASTISALGIVLYCVGFLRVELELNNHKKKLNALENVAKSINPRSSDSRFKFNARGMYFFSF